MKTLQWVVLCSGAGLLFGALTFLWHGGAQAEPDYQVNQLVNNPEIKCLPQANQQVYRTRHLPQEVVPVLKSLRHQGCAACHRSSNPSRGDLPKVKAASAIVQNKSKNTIQYDVKIGTGEWQTYELKPKAYRHHAWPYKTKKPYKKSKHKSPPHVLRYDVDGKKMEQSLLLVATPKEKLGNYYYFTQKNKEDQVELKTPKKKLYRKGKK